MLARSKRRKPKTTNSRHRYRKWPNLIVDLIPERPEELIVCDITYWRIEAGFIYISLATDAYSHMILGYNVSQHLYTAGAMSAMKMVLKNRMYPDLKMIHHSDRGFQYCSGSYVSLLQANDIQISMTQSGNPTDNAIAERINGLLKQHFGLPRRFKNYQSALKPIAEAVKTYNHELSNCPLFCCNSKPYQAHRISGPINNRWKRE